MDKFDEILKNAVEGYEAPYNAQAWANVSGQLGPKNGPMNWIIGTAAVATLIVGAVYFMQEDETTPNEVVTNEVVTTENNSVNTDNLAVNETNTNNENAVSGNNQNTVDPINDKANGAITEPNNGNSQSTGTTTANGGNTNNSSTTNTSGTTTNGGNTTNNGGNTNNSGVTLEDNSTATRLNAKFKSTTNVACANEKFVFTPEDQNQKVEYTWNFGDGTESIDKVGEHTYKKAGSFTVTLTLKDAKTGKSVQTSTEVTANPLPVSQFVWTRSFEAIPTVNFNNTTEDALKGTWNIQGLKSTSENQFEYTFRNRGTYVVKLTTENEFGCQHTIQKPIVIEEDYNLLAANIFQPNGDNQNDYFIPAALEVLNVDFNMVIYDKNGTQMYQTNSVYSPWDGTNMSDNSQAPAGTYVWIVQYKNANGEQETYQSTIHLMR